MFTGLHAPSTSLPAFCARLSLVSGRMGPAHPAPRALRPVPTSVSRCSLGPGLSAQALMHIAPCAYLVPGSKDVL